MSFSCYLHGWSHIYNPCPLCNQTQTNTTNGVFVDLGQKKEAIDWRSLCDELAEVIAFNKAEWVAININNYKHMTAWQKCDEVQKKYLAAKRGE